VCGISKKVSGNIITSAKKIILSKNFEGIVVKSTGSWYVVREKSTGKQINCRIKGKFRIQGIKSTNPVCVGDRVLFIELLNEESGLIIEIMERHNYIIRKATKLSRLSHIIAANIDQAILIVTLTHPRTSTGFIDRFLVTAEAYHIPAVVVFNKIDLYNVELQKQHDEVTRVYSRIGYPCIAVSALRGDNLAAVKKIMTDKVSLMAGHSGVGKSELINAIEPRLNLKTGDISSYHRKGKHTTTFTEMLELSFGGYIIDTPGLKEFGLVDFKKEEVWERFPEMRELSPSCQYNNCTHIHEPGCAVKEALEKGNVSAFRYKNYLNILEDDEFRRR